MRTRKVRGKLGRRERNARGTCGTTARKARNLADSFVRS